MFLVVYIKWVIENINLIDYLMDLGGDNLCVFYGGVFYGGCMV